MNKIIFIQPKSSGHSWEALNFGYLASFLKSKGFTNLEFYSAFDDDEDTIVNACVHAEIVGFSCASPQVSSLRHLAAAIKEKNPDVWIVAGGVHPSALPDETLAIPGVDQVVIGEGEAAMRSIAQGNREPVVNASPIANLDDLPFPDRHFVKQERQIQKVFQEYRMRVGSIFSSRGCPFACTFCASHCVWGRKVRFRSPQNVLDEFRMIVEEFHLDQVFFADDTVTVNRKWLTEFCRQKHEQGLDTFWACNTRVDSVDRAMLEMMWDSGCRELWFGVESGSPTILKEMNKRITLDQVRQVFAWTKEIGFQRRAYILLGMPGETAEDIQLTDELLEDIQPDKIGFFFFIPFPGTAYYDAEFHRQIKFSDVNFYNNQLRYRTKFFPDDEWNAAQERLLKKYDHFLSIAQHNALHPISGDVEAPLMN